MGYSWVYRIWSEANIVPSVAWDNLARYEEDDEVANDWTDFDV